MDESEICELEIVMKQVSFKASLASDRVDPKFYEQLGVDRTRTGKDKRYEVKLPEGSVQMPESWADAQQIGDRAFKAMTTQLLTSAQNLYRESFAKASDAKLLKANRLRATQVAMVDDALRAEYLACTTVESAEAWLDKFYEENLAE